jgi:hypothetical protein
VIGLKPAQVGRWRYESPAGRRAVFDGTVDSEEQGQLFTEYHFRLQCLLDCREDYGSANVMTERLDTQRVADILLSCWVVAHGPREPFPMGSGILDLALKRAIDRGAFPPEFASLHFLQTPVGYRSESLPSIVHQAQMSGLITSPNPFYQAGIVHLSQERALMILDELEITDTDARSWGAMLKEEISRAETS